LRLLELFCGTKSISKEFNNWDVISVDIDPQFNPTFCSDIRGLNPAAFKNIDFIWASPPCTTFSVASIGRHWNHDRTPKTFAAWEGLTILNSTLDFINIIKPKIGFIIENPRGMMRKMDCMQDFKRYTVTYCQYGIERMKPTDLWSNLDLEFKPACKNGDPCHVSAPRGSVTGTQGHGNAIDRGIIPAELAQSIYEQINSRSGNTSHTTAR
jgi:hypothetical protein